MIGEAAALSKEPRAIDPGLNVSVGASLLGQFGNDSVNLERVEERRIERDQSNATPIRRSLRQLAFSRVALVTQNETSRCHRASVPNCRSHNTQRRHP